MTKHPLTEEMMDKIHGDEPGYSNPYDEDDMRAAYDFAIDRCVDWLEDNDCDDPQATAKTLKKAMYSPLEDNS